jgi:hypothetical protein
MIEMMTEQHDPLEKLFTQPTVSASEIAAFILDYMRIYPQTLQVGFFMHRRITVRQKILLYLLALVVLDLQGKRVGRSATSQGIADALELIPGTVRPEVKKLADDHLIYHKQSEYSIPLGAFNKVRDYIKELST